MNNLTDAVFILSVTWLLIHELDAIKQHEWRFFFQHVPVSDETAYRAFTALHVPLFILILWYLQAGWLQVVFDVFLIVHAALHIGLRRHPLVSFDSGFSGLWIYGGAFLGLFHLVLLWIA